MEHTCKNCEYAVGWIDNERFMMCDYYKGKVDGSTCYHWKAKDECEDKCKSCVHAVLESIGESGKYTITNCEISNKRIDPNHASCHDFTRRNSIDAEEKTYDPVNSPKHYTSGKVECIDAMIETFGVEAVKHFCLCNAFKYHWRHELKNGDEDIKKATWYMDKYKELANR